MKYFSEKEFNRCDPPCKMSDMKPEFLEKLDELREVCGIPLVLNCAYRSREHDLAKGRSGNSAHTRGYAVDVRCLSSETRLIIVRGALHVGINRIGIGATFLHLDIDPSLPQYVIFHYY